MSLELNERIKIAYKKLKASIYFDKTQLPLRNQLLKYEENIDENLNILYKYLNGNDNKWEKFQEEIINKISTYIYPKTLSPIHEDTIFINRNNTQIYMEEPQFFINLPVEGHILGALWILSIGLNLDKNSDNDTEGMYEHSYGNRLKKKSYQS